MRMRTLTAVEFLSVDGVTQGYGSPDEDREGGFEHGGWGSAYAGDADAVAGAALAATTAYLFGRRTYQHMAAFWPWQPDSNPMAAHLNATPKYVASRQPQTLDWAGAELLTGALPDAVAVLKATSTGTITVLGSGMLLGELLRHDLVDELHLFVHPLLLGSGRRLFRELDEPRRLRPVESACLPKGTLFVRYALER
jgi:dihydrofolate reductase